MGLTNKELLETQKSTLLTYTRYIDSMRRIQIDILYDRQWKYPIRQQRPWCQTASVSEPQDKHHQPCHHRDKHPRHGTHQPPPELYPYFIIRNCFAAACLTACQAAAPLCIHTEDIQYDSFSWQLFTVPSHIPPHLRLPRRLHEVEKLSTVFLRALNVVRHLLLGY